MKFKSILVFGAENILALPVIRTLGTLMPKAKIHTFSPQNKFKSISELSRFISSRDTFDFWDEDNLQDKLMRKIRQTGADLIIPVGNPAFRTLAKYKSKLPARVHHPPLSSPEVYDMLEIKDQLMEFLQKNQLLQCRTQRLTEIKPDQLTVQDFPLMLKPVIGSAGSGIKKIEDAASLSSVLKFINPEKYILQEYITGKDYGCSILAVNGKIKAYTIQAVLDNKNFGVATAIKFIEDDQILQFTEKVVRQAGYSGVAHLDFRKNENTGKPILLDFNARFWFSMMGSRAAGVDFVFLSCLAAAGIPFEKPDYHCITYFIGKNTFEYYLRKTFQLKPHLGSTADQIIHTDFWDRIRDPLPEIARYVG